MRLRGDGHNVSDCHSHCQCVALKATLERTMAMEFNISMPPQPVITAAAVPPSLSRPIGIAPVPEPPIAKLHAMSMVPAESKHAAAMTASTSPTSIANSPEGGSGLKRARSRYLVAVARSNACRRAVVLSGSSELPPDPFGSSGPSARPCISVQLRRQFAAASAVSEFHSSAASVKRARSATPASSVPPAAQ